MIRGHTEKRYIWSNMWQIAWKRQAPCLRSFQALRLYCLLQRLTTSTSFLWLPSDWDRRWVEYTLVSWYKTTFLPFCIKYTLLTYNTTKLSISKNHGNRWKVDEIYFGTMHCGHAYPFSFNGWDKKKSLFEMGWGGGQK